MKKKKSSYSGDLLVAEAMAASGLPINNRLWTKKHKRIYRNILTHMAVAKVVKSTLGSQGLVTYKGEIKWGG